MTGRIIAAIALASASAVSASAMQQGGEAVTHYEATSGPASIVDGFYEALSSKNEKLVRQLLADNVVIAENGAAERSFAAYAEEHLGADMQFMSGVKGKLKNRDEYVSGDLAVVVSEHELDGEFTTKPVRRHMIETVVLKRHDLGWRIEHVHWSSKDRPAD